MASKRLIDSQESSSSELINIVEETKAEEEAIKIATIIGLKW